jgi:diguanylate cyclase (GGDEF)-like protein
LRIGTKIWIGAVASLTLAQMSVSALFPAGLRLTAISDSLSVVLYVVLLTAFALNAAPTRGRLRAFWIMQAFGWGFTLISQCWWMVYDLILRKPVPILFAGDVLLFFPGILMLAGFLLRPHLGQSERSARLGLLDFCLLVIWWVFLYVCLVTCWQYVSPNNDLYNRNYDRLYLAENLVLMGVLGLLVKTSEGAWRRLYAVFLAAVAFSYLGFYLENRAIESSLYFSGSWYDTPYMAAFAFFMLPALRGRGLGQIRQTKQDGRYGSWMSRLAILAVLSLPILLFVAMIEPGVSPSILRFRVLVTAVAMFAMAGLVFMKQQLLHAELQETNQVLEESSSTDPLTGIRNRRFFQSVIESDVAQTLRAYTEGDVSAARDLVFYLIDLDSFKKINDLHGHDGGDRVLIEASRRILSVLRSSDLLVRWGGEEFLVVSRVTDRKQAGVLAERVLEAVREKPFDVGASEQVSLTCSIGWAAFPWLDDDVEAMGYEAILKFADRGLYRAKKAGKDRAIGMTPIRDTVHSIEDEPNVEKLPNAGSASRVDPGELHTVDR